jgi:hypothetical protein
MPGAVAFGLAAGAAPLSAAAMKTQLELLAH